MSPSINVERADKALVRRTAKEHAAAVSLYARRVADAAEAQNLVKAIESEWARGVDTRSALDLLAAKAEKDRSAFLIRSAELAVRTTEANLVNDDTRLALAFAPFAAQATPCESVVVTPVRPNLSDLPTDGPFPVLYLVQPKACTSPYGPSLIAGEIEVVLIRKASHKELDVEKSIDAAERSDWLARSQVGALSMQVGDLFEDSITIEVRKGYEEIPVIQSITTGDAMTKQYADMLARKAAAGMQAWDAQAVGGRLGSGDASEIEETIIGIGEPGSVESVKVLPNGIRETVVKVQIVGFRNDPRENPDRIVSQFSRAITNQVGEANPYFGRCVEAEVSGVEPRTQNAHAPAVGRAIFARMTFHSQPVVAAA